MISPGKLKRTRVTALRNPDSAQLLQKIRPTRVVAQLLGISPTTVQNGRIHRSLWKLVYGVTLISVSACTRIALEKFEERRTFYESVMHVNNLILPASCILSLMIMLFYGNKLIQIVNESLELSSYIEPAALKHIFWKQIFLISFAISAVLLNSTLLYSCCPEFYSGSSNLMARVFEIQLGMTMSMLKLQFVTLIMILTKILKIVPNGIHMLGKSYSPLSMQTPALTDVNRVVTIYDKVITLAEGLNSCYGFAMGIASLTTALHLIMFAYFHLVLGGTTGWLVIGYGATSIFQEWVVLQATEGFMAKVKEISQVVYSAMRDSPSTYLQQQLQQFSIYLLHRKIRFTICGLVSLDYSLLFSMGGAITTYVVILVQFQKTENPEGSSSNITPANQ